MRHHENGEHRTNEWKDVLIDELITSFVYKAEHETNPRKALGDLIAWEVEVALDPQVSSEAAALIEKHVEERMAPLVKAVTDLYFSAYWHADRRVDEAGLWTALRDAAGIKPGQTAEILGVDRATA